ncbi:MAG: patatin-like phospholipase family protein [Candidatus Paceibacterota bacterium]
MNDNIMSPKIGLALGGGGARGYAHIGVIKALEKNNIPIDLIAGTSAGALVGALYSFFKNCEDVEQVALGNDLFRLLGLVDPSFAGGLIKGDKLRNFLVQVFEGVGFDGLQIPFSAVTTGVGDAKIEVFCSGDLASAVQASAAFPLVFNPVALDNKILWDGGMSDPVPADVAKRMGADIVIAVNLYNKSAFEGRKEERKEGAYEIAARAIEALQYNLSNECLKCADIVIEPSVAGVDILGLDKFLKGGDEIILEGEKAAIEALPKIKETIERYSRSRL